MRRFKISATVFALAVCMGVSVAFAGEGKVLKVLPQFLDKKGREGLYPSLYERDAYQVYLRKHPDERASLRLEVQWKAKNVDWSNVKLRAEMRGVSGNSLRAITLEQTAVKKGWFSTWAEFKISGDEFKQFGDLAAWHVSLWEGTTKLSELKSSLWEPQGQ